MNELIKELAFNSGLIQYASDSKMADVEKFAEAIVKECVNVADEVSMDDTIGYALLEHFGVE